MKRVIELALPLALVFQAVPASTALTQPATIAEESAAKQSAGKLETIYGDDVPGVGPIRSEDWFVKTWRERRANFAKQKAEQHQAIVFFGDSITQGWSDEFRGKFKHANLKLANRGISGDTTRGLLARVGEDVLSLRPRGVVLLIGTNDIGLGLAPSDIAGNLKLLLENLSTHNPKMPIILCLVMPSSAKKDRPADKIRELNERFAELARGNEQVTVLDTYTLFANQDGDAKLEEFPDLLHPNDVGYAKWQSALWPLMATVGFVETEPDAFTPESGFTPLFDGHDLDGWGFRATNEAELEMIRRWRASDKRMPAFPIVEAPQNFDDRIASPDGRYRAIAGRLVVTTPTEGRRIQRLDTRQDFAGDFTLKLEFRATPNADSGVFVRGKQLQCRDYALAGPYKNLQNYRPGDWNELVIKVRHNQARCACNGEVIEEAFEVPESGPIGLEGDRGQMEYRRIRLRSE